MKKAETETEPLITVSSTETENRKYYTGPGYTAGYYTDKYEDTDGNVTQNSGCSAKYWYGRGLNNSS